FHDRGGPSVDDAYRVVLEVPDVDLRTGGLRGADRERNERPDECLSCHECVLLVRGGPAGRPPAKTGRQRPAGCWSCHGCVLVVRGTRAGRLPPKTVGQGPAFPRE